jgi:hypothetical protein
MIVQALFQPFSLAVLVLVMGMLSASVAWYLRGSRDDAELEGGIKVLRRVGTSLRADHPVRKRLESGPVTELSLEELAQLLVGKEGNAAANGLLALEHRLNWMERFAQFSTYLGILGTVLGLVMSDPNNLVLFRQKLTLGLGATFYGLMGGLLINIATGSAEQLIVRARQRMRMALIASFDTAPTLPNESTNEPR